MHIAGRNNQLELVRALLAASGCDNDCIQMVNNADQTAYDLTTNEEIKALLEQYLDSRLK